MKELRNKLYAKGYGLIYTFGISKTAVVYSLKGTFSKTFDMTDTEKGKREVEAFLNSLQEEN